METTTSRIPPPDFFEGQTSEDATIWLEQLEMYATLNNLATATAQMAALGCNTDAVIMCLIRGLPENMRDTVATQQKVLECICKIHLCDNINIMDITHETSQVPFDIRITLVDIKNQLKSHKSCLKKQQHWSNLQRKHCTN